MRILGHTIRGVLGDCVANHSRSLAAEEAVMGAHWSNGVLFALLFIAGYLSTATIVALPTQLEDISAAASELDQLRTALRGEDRRLAADVEALTREDPFDELVRVLSAPSAVRGAETVREELAEHQAQRSRLIDEVFNARASWAGQVTRAQDRAIALFAENVDRKGNAERREHASGLLRWFDEHLGEAQREMNECLGAAKVADQDARAWAKERVRVLPLRGERPIALAVRWQRAREQCEERWSFKTAPSRAELGGRYGPFQGVSAWLIRTESLSLMTCVGLLGFGLLGAAASSFIRDQSSRRLAQLSQPQPLVSDLAAVVIRGLVAAVVVFLAVKGGLSVFAVDAPDPNPYVLLLTCLVAAIFSEPVFEWARQRIGLPSPEPPPDTVAKHGGTSEPPPDETAMDSATSY